MLYNNVSELPAEIKMQYKGAKLHQFIHIVNSKHELGLDEAKAFVAAHSAVSKKELGWDDIYDVMNRQVAQDYAGYNPVGGNNEKACANCQYYIAKRDACVLVTGDIAPTGISDLWEERVVYVPQPIPVVIVKEKSAIKSLWDGIKSLFSVPDVTREPVQSGIFFQYNEGTPTRFFIWASNNFKDNHGEIITEASHKEFIEWCDTNNAYPELWLWHAAGSKCGQVDWLDYADGFLVASGLVDEKANEIVNSLEGQDVRASHGFIGKWKDNQIIQYRSWEISALPGFAAANSWTGYAAIKEEAEMSFSQKKRDWLMHTAGVDEAKIVEWETATVQAAEQLKALGIEFKSDDDPAPKEEADDNALALTVASLVSQQGEVIKVLAALSKEIGTIKGDDDTKIADLIKAEIEKMPHGFKPTESTETRTKEGDPIPPDVKKEQDSWFADLATPAGFKK